MKVPVNKLLVAKKVLGNKKLVAEKVLGNKILCPSMSSVTILGKQQQSSSSNSCVDTTLLPDELTCSSSGLSCLVLFRVGWGGSLTNLTLGEGREGHDLPI